MRWVANVKQNRPRRVCKVKWVVLKCANEVIVVPLVLFLIQFQIFIHNKHKQQQSLSILHPHLYDVISSDLLPWSCNGYTVCVLLHSDGQVLIRFRNSCSNQLHVNCWSPDLMMQDAHAACAPYVHAERHIHVINQDKTTNSICSNDKPTRWPSMYGFKYGFKQADQIKSNETTAKISTFKCKLFT